MIGPVITGKPVSSKVMSVGQAPGIKEGDLGRPFAWTAGKTLFKWFSTIGLDEAAYRDSIYMAAVCRCFPGKNAKGGDRVPSPAEIENCSPWLRREIELLQPELLIPIGKLAIVQFMPCTKLSDVIGQVHRVEYHGYPVDLIPLPHPSGLSTWFRTEPGKTLLDKAMDCLESHPSMRRLM